ncbi:hypothetical protein ATCVMN08101_983R [Acanthocystis turfacea Chlorella virus MN0810.1]|nr:hypothetical protein ATCVMN08101_983R [Acanthocystis turfacea Chlorella virus MN0810.1]
MFIDGDCCGIGIIFIDGCWENGIIFIDGCWENGIIFIRGDCWGIGIGPMGAE